ncbi:MAG: exo-beta-N-acetylmuramidase NamZ domain-containing protein [Fidelibacterota bacterium]
MRPIALLLLGLLTAQEGIDSGYKYSHILDVPNLIFMKKVFCGLDMLEQMDFSPLRGKRIAVSCGPGSLDNQGRHILDVLQTQPDITVKYIYVPENGLFAEDNDRLKLVGKDLYDPVTGARIIDIFGRNIMPPEWTFQDIDAIVIDLVDSGIRYTTYMTSATKIFEASASYNIPIYVLDRPNPLGGLKVDGPVVRPAFQSFEGYHLVPIRHGFTPGEYLLMVNEMGWARNSARVDLIIIPNVNWKRGMWQDDTGIPFVSPYPDISSLEALLAFTGMGLLRGTNLNVGHGTDKPYLRFGAPWISSLHILEKLDELSLEGVEFRRIRFTPRMRQGEKIIPQYLNTECSGLELRITDRLAFDPIATATAIIIVAHQLYPREFQWAEGDYIDKLFGYDLLRQFTVKGKPADYLPPLWFHDVLKFAHFRKQFLLY